MPELPEVESVRLQLNKFLIGHKILGVKINYPKSFEGESKLLLGAKIVDIRRFAKVLAIDLSNNYSIVIHIKLTGQLIYRGPNLKKSSPLSIKVIGGIPGPHTLVEFGLDKKARLYYNDVRRFGWIKIIKTSLIETTGFVSKLGPEPFRDLDLEKFINILYSTKRSIKILLMDQSKISGVGNIYANDALWLAKIHPVKPSDKLTKPEQTRLFEAMEEVLKKGLEKGGASELAFVTPDGSEGNYQNFFLAYGQEGNLCPRCKKAKFKKFKLGGRGTVYCPICQKP